ncbi:hypothetical protein Trydic_g3471 [Trypoxylus dichotomus]
MSRVDNIALANKKNSVNKTRLVAEINRIDREKSIIIRQMNNEKQRFKSKYSKFDVLSEHRGTEPSDVVMYTTHNPGFCYRRNGECRMPPSLIKSTTLGFEDIHVLIFTDGELDVDKVLCLHLLSVHRTETLTPPPREQRTLMYLAKKQAPLERLIERTKKRWPEDRLTRLLPIYVIDSGRNTLHSKSDNLIRDGRLAARLIVNEKINELIRSVMIALEKTNKDMILDFINKARDEEYLKVMVNQPKIQDFFKNLNGLNVISCCESFSLTLPFRIVPITLDVGTSSGQLENLVKQIRKNIFKLPINCCWDDECTTVNLYSDVAKDGVAFVDSPFSEREIFSQNLDVFETRTRSKNSPIKHKTSSIDGSILETVVTPRSSQISNIINITNSPSHTQGQSNENPTLNRQKLALTTKKTRREKMQRSSKFLNPQQMRDVDFEKVANLLYKKVNNAIQRDLDNLQKTKGTTSNTNSYANKGSNEEPLLSQIGSIDGGIDETIENNTKINERETRILLKQTKCAACREKWRRPLPVPKTSYISKKVVQQLDDSSLRDVMTNSSHLLSSLIDQEMKFWKEYKVLKNESCLGGSQLRFSQTHSFDRNNIIEIIDLKALDLAKVRQEIREHETKKKLEEFLKS